MTMQRHRLGMATDGHWYRMALLSCHHRGTVMDIHGTDVPWHCHGLQKVLHGIFITMPCHWHGTTMGFHWLPWPCHGLPRAFMTIPLAVWAFIAAVACYCHGLSKHCHGSATSAIGLGGSVMGLPWASMALTWSCHGNPSARCSTAYHFMTLQWAFSMAQINSHGLHRLPWHATRHGYGTVTGLSSGYFMDCHGSHATAMALPKPSMGFHPTATARCVQCALTQP